MKFIVLKFVVNILNIIYLPIKLLKIKNKIVYISRQSNTESLDFKLIRQEIERRFPKYQNVILSQKIEQGTVNKIKYCMHVMKQMYHIATSKVVILDSYSIPVSILKHKNQTKIIQIWHALGAIKKFGYQSIDKPSGAQRELAKVMCMHRNYDYILAPSQETAKYYKEAFSIKEEQIKYIGMPRIDYIFKDNEEIKKKIYDTYPILRKKNNIVYVPTFRKGEKVELDELVEKIDTNKYNLIIKLHPLDLKNYNYKKRDGVIYETQFKTYDLIKIADKIITDYSSLAIEVAILYLPIYFYTYDIDKYTNDPGLNIDFKNEDIGKYQTSNIQELLKMIDENYDYDILEVFKKKYISVNTKDCTKQIVEFIVRLMNDEDVEDMGNKPIKEESNI